MNLVFSFKETHSLNLKWSFSLLMALSPPSLLALLLPPPPLSMWSSQPTSPLPPPTPLDYHCHRNCRNITIISRIAIIITINIVTNIIIIISVIFATIIDVGTTTITITIFVVIVVTVIKKTFLNILILMG